MTQNPKLLAMGLAGGYLLGRTRKAKLALAVASLVLGRRMGVNPQQLLTEGLKKLSDTPEFSRLEEQIRGELMSAGRSMITAAANRRMDSLSDALRDRTDALSAPDGGEEPEEEAEEPEEEEQEEQPTSRKAPPKETRAKKSTSEKAPPKKKAPPEKSTAKKSASRPASAEKTTTRGSGAKKSPSRSTGRR